MTSLQEPQERCVAQSPAGARPGRADATTDTSNDQDSYSSTLRLSATDREMLLLFRGQCRLGLEATGRASRLLAPHAFAPQARHFSKVQRQSEPYGAVVAGAGPGGLAVVGNLLENNLRGKLFWVDPKFNAGLVGEKWVEVPSNTKVNLFTAFGEGTKPFQDVIANTPEPNAMSEMKTLDPNSTCSLHYAADMVRMLSTGLSEQHGVEKRTGQIAGADYDSSRGMWTCQTLDFPSQTTSTLSSRSVVMATGAHPIATNIPVPGLQLRQLDVEAALRPSQLAAFFKDLGSEPQTVAVVGASHTAVLILYNLYTLSTSKDSPVPDLKIKWFTRSPLRYAEPRDGWILRDNTGLKGHAAQWAKENLEDDKRASSPVGNVIERIDCNSGKEKAAYEQELPHCNMIVQAIGFQPNDALRISVDGKIVKKPVYDNVNGGFVDESSGKELPGLFGAGIAFPERVKDPEGNIEYAVGMWKFMKYLKKVVPEWVKQIN